MRFVSVLLVTLTLGACAPSDSVVRPVQPVQEHGGEYGTRFVCTAKGKTYTITARERDYFINTDSGFVISIGGEPGRYLGLGLEYQCERTMVYSDQPIVPSIVVTEQ